MKDSKRIKRIKAKARKHFMDFQRTGDTKDKALFDLEFQKLKAEQATVAISVALHIASLGRPKIQTH